MNLWCFYDRFLADYVQVLAHLETWAEDSLLSLLHLSEEEEEEEWLEWLEEEEEWEVEEEEWEEETLNLCRPLPSSSTAEKLLRNGTEILNLYPSLGFHLIPCSCFTLS